MADQYADEVGAAYKEAEGRK
jgi:hypothetical protein